VPQLWRPESGTTEALSFRIEGHHTIVPLTLRPGDAVFIVFSGPPPLVPSAHAPPPRIETLATLPGPWEVSFPSGWGAPGRTRFDRLQQWNRTDDPGIRYFSGTATYSRTFIVPPQWLSRLGVLRLDLGDVREVAEVRVNGESLGIVWNPPYQVDLHAVLHPGRNQLEVKVANLWVNRLIGDAQPTAAPRYTSTALPTYRPDAPLRPSGLLGPVTILRAHGSAAN
jgi:hypothetical protein